MDDIGEEEKETEKESSSVNNNDQHCYVTSFQRLAITFIIKVRFGLLDEEEK